MTPQRQWEETIIDTIAALLVAGGILWIIYWMGVK